MTEKIKPRQAGPGANDAEQMQDKDINFSPDFDAEILQEGPAAQPMTPADIVGEVESKAKQANHFTGEDLLLRKIDNIPCLVEPFLQKTGLAALAGSSDTGKSTILRQLTIDTVCGKSTFLGWKLNTKHQAAIVVSTEDDPTAISFLLSRQAKDIEPEKLRNLRFLFDFENLIPELDAMLTAQAVDLVVIDCFADAFTGDLKDTTRIRAYTNQCQVLAEKHQCLFLFLHHTGKRSENFEPNKNNLLSGQGFEAKMRLVIELRADPARADLRHLCIVKGNYLAAEHKRESYVLTFDPDTFLFKETKERTPFELLSKKPDDDGRQRFEEAKALKDAGLSLSEIAEKLGFANKSSISRLLKKYGENGED